MQCYTTSSLLYRGFYESNSSSVVRNDMTDVATQLMYLVVVQFSSQKWVYTQKLVGVVI